MRAIKEKDVVKVKITGIQKYGAFASTKDDYDGLIHISEISYGYVKNINDFISVGDNIYAEVVNVDDNSKHLKLGVRLKRMAETKNGFEPLRNHLEPWINDKIKEITDNF